MDTKTKEIFDVDNIECLADNGYFDSTDLKNYEQNQSSNFVRLSPSSVSPGVMLKEPLVIEVAIDLDDGVKVNYKKFQGIEVSSRRKKTRKSIY